MMGEGSLRGGRKPDEAIPEFVARDCFVASLLAMTVPSPCRIRGITVMPSPLGGRGHKYKRSSGAPQLPWHNRAMTRIASALAGLLLSAAGAFTALAQDRGATQADLQLILAVDTSGSVDQRRFELQKQGYVAAFRNPRVLAAIRSGARQNIAVTMTQWTGPALQMQVVPWTLIGDTASVTRFAAAIDDVPRQLFFAAPRSAARSIMRARCFPQARSRPSGR